MSAPGQLQEGDEFATSGLVTTELPDTPLAELAAQHGLRPSAERPPVVAYIRHLWQRRHFIMAFATARNIAMYTEARLGQVWQVLTPLLNAGVYFLIFGLLLHINRGIPNYLGFLVTGVFVFNFTQRAFISTSTVITDSLPLIRALQFPRAALPLAYVMIELQQMLLSMAVLFVVVLTMGEPLTWYWLLLFPALALQIMFNAGIALFAARIGARVNDFAQLLPFLMRTWLYLSGVIYSIQIFVAEHGQNYGWATDLLQLNPAAIYITLVRNSLMASQRATAFGARPYNAAKCHAWATDASAHLYGSAYCHATVISSHLWLIGAGWAVAALLGGFMFFWRKEVFYGRG
jgi:teichoic acid transport system permease protein